VIIIETLILVVLLVIVGLLIIKLVVDSENAKALDVHLSDIYDQLLDIEEK